MKFEVPIKVPSAANLREYWAKRAARVKSQRNATTYRMPKWTEGPLLMVTLTRVAPRELDKDNLQGALKAIRDAVASKLRIDDATPLVEWRYQQEKCGAKEAPVVRVEIGALDFYTPPRAKPVDAGKEAQVFAPCAAPGCERCCIHAWGQEG